LRIEDGRLRIGGPGHPPIINHQSSLINHQFLTDSSR
jgi:hypothetical protein